MIESLKREMSARTIRLVKEMSCRSDDTVLLCLDPFLLFLFLAMTDIAVLFYSVRPEERGDGVGTRLHVGSNPSLRR